MTTHLSVCSSLLDSNLAKYISQISRIPMLSPDRERFLAERLAKHSDVEAAKELVVSHLRLVAKVAFKFKGYGLPMSDIISEGNIGLMNAVKKFRVDMNCRLSTYAMWWIKASIQSYILKTWSFVKIGATALKKKLFCNLKNIESKLQERNSKDIMKNIDEEFPRYGEYEEDMSKNQIDQACDMTGYMRFRCESIESDKDINNAAYVFSLSNSSDEEDSGFGDFIDSVQDTNCVNPEDSAIEQQNNNIKALSLRDAMDSLNERERDIIKSRHLTEKPLTLEDLSQIHHISKERVRQIENRALEKLRISLVEDLNCKSLYSN